MDHMDDERDLVVFVDDEGDEVTMEVLDYFFYEGEEYAVLSELDEACDDCERDDCDGCDAQREAYVMKVVPVGKDEEEFIPVEEELAEKLIQILETEDFDADELDDEE